MRWGRVRLGVVGPGDSGHRVDTHTKYKNKLKVRAGPRELGLGLDLAGWVGWGGPGWGKRGTGRSGAKPARLFEAEAGQARPEMGRKDGPGRAWQGNFQLGSGQSPARQQLTEGVGQSSSSRPQSLLGHEKRVNLFDLIFAG